MRKLILTVLTILIFTISSFSQAKYESTIVTTKRYSPVTMHFETMATLYKPTQITIFNGVTTFISGQDTLTLQSTTITRQVGDLVMVAVRDQKGRTATLAMELSKKDPEDVQKFQIMYLDRIIIFERIIEVVPKVL